MSEKEFCTTPIDRHSSLTLHIGVITIFPEMISSLGHYGITSRALKSKFIEITTQDPREFSGNAYNSIDDRPYGGGAGMVMRYEPLKKSHEKLKQIAGLRDAKTIYLSPQGKLMTQERIKALTLEMQPIIFICGRYEGIDQRVIDDFVDEEWSIGNYILSGGELATMVCIDAFARLVPGVLKNTCSVEEESFSEGLLEQPHYTKPREINHRTVPEVLLSGNHALISKWKRQQSLGNTWVKRPELLTSYHLSAQDDCLLEAFKVEYLKR